MGNDLSLVLTCSLNGGKENKLVTNSFVKETRTIWHHLSRNLPKWEGAGGAWHPSLPEEKKCFLKGAERSSSGKNQIETRRPFAVMLSNRAGTSLQAV